MKLSGEFLSSTSVATWQSSTEETELGNRQGIILLLVQLLILVEGYEATLRETIGNLE